MFRKFPSINQFHNTVKFLHREPLRTDNNEVMFVGKYKLHGSNMAIGKISDGRYFYQKRTGLIGTEDDCFGFAQTCEERKDEVNEAMKDLPNGAILYGEYCGPGIQKGVAVSELPEKKFFPFAISVLDEEGNPYFHYSPDGVAEYFQNFFVRDNEDYSNTDINDSFIDISLNYIKPKDVELDFNGVIDSKVLQSALDHLNEEAEKVGEHCIFTEKTYNIQGQGEGMVFMPVRGDGRTPLSYEDISKFAFKVKAEKHRVNKQKKAVQVDASKFAKINDFVNAFVTEQRFEQMYQAMEGEKTLQNIPEILKLMGNDVQKESVDELEASGMEWKEVAKAVNAAVVDMYKQRVEQDSLNGVE